MKKVISLLFIALSIVSLTACKGEELIDISGFISRYNELSENKVEFEELYCRENDDGEIFSFSYLEGRLLIRLVANGDNNISECRVILAKLSPEGKSLETTDEAMELYRNCVSSTACAFTGSEKENGKRLVNEFMLTEKSSFLNEGELTKGTKDYYYVYLSNPLVNEFIIYKKSLHEIALTEKPESKVAFDSTTNVRTETVPLN